MPQAPAGLEAIVAKNQAAHIVHAPAAVEGAEEAPADETEEGVHQTQRMRPPEPKPNMLNQAMAEAAAKEFKKKEKRIQKACAKLDDPEGAKASPCCIIL